MVLGSRRGALTVATYLFYGLAGLPVFAGGAWGIAVLFGPSGGYLIGFILASYTTGYLAERQWDRRAFSTALAMAIGSAVIFIPGLIWLAQFVGWQRVLVLGLYPFLIGDVIKIGLATALLPYLWKISRPSSA